MLGKYELPSVDESWAPPVASDESGVVFIDGNNVGYSAAFARAKEGLNFRAFPKSSNYNSYQEFVEALSAWNSELQEHLDGAQLPALLSRVCARPRVMVLQTTGDDSTDDTDDTAEERDSSSTGGPMSPRGMRDVASPTMERALAASSSMPATPSSPRPDHSSAEKDKTSAEKNSSSDKMTTTAAADKVVSLQVSSMNVVLRPEWRGWLVPSNPLYHLLSSEEAFAELQEQGVDMLTVLRRWAYVTVKSGKLCPHPQVLGERLGVARSKELLAQRRKQEQERKQEGLRDKRIDVSGSVAARQKGANVIVRSGTGFWNATFERARAGILYAEAPMKTARVTLLHDVAEWLRQRSFTRLAFAATAAAISSSKDRVRSSSVDVWDSQTPSSASPRSDPTTPSLSAQRRRRNSVYAIGVDEEEGGESDSHEEDELLKGANATPSKSPSSSALAGLKEPAAHASAMFDKKAAKKRDMLAMEPIPDVALSSSMARTTARVRAQRLFGNLYSKRVLAAIARREKFYSTPITCDVPLRWFALSEYPIVFVSHNLSERQLIKYEPKTPEKNASSHVVALVPQVEESGLNMILLCHPQSHFYHDEQREEMNRRIGMGRWDQYMSWSCTRSGAMRFPFSHEAARSWLLESLARDKVLSDDLLLSWLRIEVALDIWKKLLATIMPQNVSITAPGGTRMDTCNAGSSIGMVMFRACCVCLGTGTTASGVRQLSLFLTETTEPLHRYKIGLLVLHSLVPIFRCLPELSNADLSFLCKVFSFCQAAPPDLLEQQSVDEIQVILAAVLKGAESELELAQAIYKDYYLGYMADCKMAIDEFSEDAFGVLSTFRAAHQDYLKKQMLLRVDRKLFRPLLETLGQRVLRIASFPVVGTHAAFLLCRILCDRSVLLSMLVNAFDLKQAFIPILFSICGQARTERARYALRCVLKSLFAVENFGRMLNGFYNTHSAVCISHLTSPKVNIFVDEFLVEELPHLLAAEAAQCMLYSASESQQSWAQSTKAKATSNVFNCVCDALLQSDEKPPEVRLRLAKIFHMLASAATVKLVDLPKDLTPLVAVAGRFASEPMAAFVLRGFVSFIGGPAKASLSPEKQRGAWTVITDLARGNTAGGESSDGSSSESTPSSSSGHIPSLQLKKQAAAGAGSAANSNNNNNGPLSPTSGNRNSSIGAGAATQGATLRNVSQSSSSPSPMPASKCGRVLPEVNQAAWSVVEAYLMTTSDGVSQLSSARFLAPLLASVAPHSPPGVAANAVITFARLLTIVPGDDVKFREKTSKALVAQLIEKRFHVQVHLLFGKRDTARNLYALATWANVVLSSSLAQKIHKEVADSQEYLGELVALSALTKVEKK